MNPKPTTLMPGARPARPKGRTDIRRRDRAVTDDSWIEEMLHAAGMGVLATERNGQPFVNGNLFAYDEGARVIYLHTARYGRTRDTVVANDSVAFTVMELGRMLPSPTALGFSCEYASVVVFGRGAVVTDEAEARLALQRLLDKYFPGLHSGRDYRPITDEELARTTVYRVAIEEWIGKKKRVADDFPGARSYPVRSMLDAGEGDRDARPGRSVEFSRQHFIAAKGLA